MPVSSINRSSSDVLQPDAIKRTRYAIAACLFVLLGISTATGFVPEVWPAQLLEIGAFSLLALYLSAGVREEKISVGPSRYMPWLIYLLPFWGVFQILAHLTVATFDTRMATLLWGALAAIFFLSLVAGSKDDTRHALLNAFAIFAILLTVLCLTQRYTSEGLVLWLFRSGRSEVFGTFASPNIYAQFIELALPVAFWNSIKTGSRGWPYALACGLLYASVIASASRAGTIVCTLELVVLSMLALLQTRRIDNSRFRPNALMLLAIPALALVFTLVVGWQRVWDRLQLPDPYESRREYTISALAMARARPLTGFGLGTFPIVYPRYAVKNFPFQVSHAHNDWAEFAADGGVPFLLLIAIPCVCAVPIAFRQLWGLGIPAVMLHACVDFPFPRPAVSGWIFMVLALLFASQAKQQDCKWPP